MYYQIWFEIKEALTKIQEPYPEVMQLLSISFSCHFLRNDYIITKTNDGDEK